MVKSERVRVSVECLVPGTRCQSGIHDEAGTVLLNSGVVLTTALRDSLIKRGISHVEINESDLAELTSNKNRARPSSAPVRHHTQTNRSAKRSGQPYSADRAVRFSRHIRQASACVDRLGSSISDPEPADVEELVKLPQQFMSSVLEDQDQAIASALDNWINSAFADRCVQMSLLSIATAVEMDLDDNDIAHVGLAAILHDLSLYLQPPSFRDPQAMLNSDDCWEYRKHSATSASLFSNVVEIGESVLLAIAQVHERSDQSGYPRGLGGSVIHPLAKIIGVSDAYLTLVTSGPGRPAFLPHDAIMFLQQDARRGVFDPSIVKAFVSHLSAFPIGSGVALDDGEPATVIRTGSHSPHEPTVVRRSDDQVIDLHDSERSIAAPLCDHPRDQMRFTADMLEELTWEDLDQQNTFV